MLDKILAFIAAFLKKTTTTTTLTPEIGSGSVYVMQFGKVVIVSGQIDASQAFTHGDALVNGLPKAKVSNPIVPLSDSNRGWGDAQLYGFLNNQESTATLRAFGQISNSSHSFRLSMAYIAA